MSKKTSIEKVSSTLFEQDFPTDLALAVVWLVASIGAIYLPILNETPVRIVFAIPVVLFIPGYCFIAALFPKTSDISLIERIAFSIGLSLAIIPLIGLGLNFTPWGIQLDSVVISLIIFSWVLVLVAFYRRAILPFEERFRVPVPEIMGRISQEFLLHQGENRVDRLLGVILAIVILISVVITVFVIVVPQGGGERFTEFYILGEKQNASDYPDQIITDQNYLMYVGVGNHEYRNVAYTIETWMVQSEFDSVTNTSHIIAMDPYDRLRLTLAQNETTIIPYNLSVKKTGYDRIEFLLFNESVPGLDVIGSDRINASYRDLNLRFAIDEEE